MAGMAFLSSLWAWIKKQRTALKWSAVGLALSFALLGLPGFASYWPAEQLFRLAGDGALLDRIHGDNSWPVLISASFLQSLLITPVHCLVQRWWPQLPRWPHVLVVVLGVLAISTVVTAMVLLSLVDA